MSLKAWFSRRILWRTGQGQGQRQPTPAGQSTSQAPAQILPQDSRSIADEGAGSDAGARRSTDVPEVQGQIQTNDNVPLRTRSGSPAIPRPSSTQSPALSVFEGARDFNVGSCFIDASHTSFNVTEPVRVPAFQLVENRIATSAIHNSADRFDAPKCDEDTRKGLLEEMFGWVDNPDTQSQIAVITGPAGSGKSAIQQTICEHYSERNGLAGSFFFSIADPTRNQHRPLFATLVYQIAQTNKDLRPFIDDAIKDEPTIFDRSLETQVQVLLINTIKIARSHHGERMGRELPELLVVDGIDECRGEEMQAHILQVIGKCFVRSKLPFKIILAGRPEYAIRTALDTYLSSAYHIKLHEHDASADIKLYLQRRLRALGTASNDPRAKDDSWPPEKTVDTLTENASGQFVYAATVVKFASNRRASPYLAIEQVLTWKPGVEQRRSPFATLDTLYSNILDMAEKAYAAESEDGRSVIGLLLELVHLKHTVLNKNGSNLDKNRPIHDAEELLQLRPGQALDMLSDLHSLVYPAFYQEPDRQFPLARIVFHHKSFLDYLSDPRRLVDPNQHKYAVHLRILRYLSEYLGAVGPGGEKGPIFLEAVKTDDEVLRKATPYVNDKLRLLCDCLAQWPFHLHASVSDRNLDADDTSHFTSLDDTLTDFFASNGWRELKAYFREGRLLSQGLLDFIWSTELLPILDIGLLQDEHADELTEFLRSAFERAAARIERENNSLRGDDEESDARPGLPSGSSENTSTSEDSH